ncbi:hypothetical protein [Deinococcus marmoris]|uniref:hypothetical protein n=1 Tax=Deinococcus marmoris TaxID=249408 RepID=UPI00096AA9E3|nr:hypothetical protein [Deinococcus marmoris]
MTRLDPVDHDPILREMRQLVREFGGDLEYSEENGQGFCRAWFPSSEPMARMELEAYRAHILTVPTEDWEGTA